MCGIHFVVNSNTTATKIPNFLSDSFLANQVRGVDSSGIFQLKTKFLKGRNTIDSDIYKEADNGSNFLMMKKAQDMLRDSSYAKATVCHVRAATEGKINDENAHPFRVERPDGTFITGVHNGTLDWWKHRKDAKGFDVDSLWLYHQIAQHGTDAFKAIEGAYALVWFDSAEPDVLNVARNSRRPLHWAWTKDKKTMIAASELGMLGWIADRNNIDLHVEDNTRFWYPEPGVLYKINLSDTQIRDRIRLPEPEKWATYDDLWGDAVKNKQSASGGSCSTGNCYPAVRHYEPVDDDTRQKKVLDMFKESLAAARKAQNTVKEAKKEVVPTNNLGAPLSANNSNTDGSVNIKKATFFHDLPHDIIASPKEQESAWKEGILGLVVNMVSYMYDNDDEAVYGDFRVIEEDGKLTVFDSILPGISPKLASSYTASTKMHQMVVVGMTQGKKPYAIVHPLHRFDHRAVRFSNQMSEKEAHEGLATVH